MPQISTTARQMLADTKRLAEDPLLAASAAGDDERRLVHLLLAENHGVPDPDYADTGGDDERWDDNTLFRVHLGRSEASRRQSYWDEAEAHLNNAERHSQGDLRRHATVHYRLARLYIDQWRHITPHAGIPRWEEDITATSEPALDAHSLDLYRKLPPQAVSNAAQAVVAIRAMDNPVGLIRAQCQQVRALVIAGRLVEAEQLCHAVWRDLLATEQDLPSWGPLLARFARASGERMLHRGMFESAWHKLSHAATLYAGHDDWTAYAEVWRLLNEVNRNYSYPTGSSFEGIDLKLDQAVASALGPVPPAPGDRT
jgi:hypothetical protein